MSDKGISQKLRTAELGVDAVSPEATNLMAGGNATGFGRHRFPDPVKGRIHQHIRPFQGRIVIRSISGGVATGY
jgi:hypothetical protein